MVKSISFSGKMASGKDSYGKLFKRAHPEAIHLSFGKALKNELYEFLKGDFKKPSDMDDKVYERLKEIRGKIKPGVRSVYLREALQLYGTDYRRKNDSDYWVRVLKKEIEENPDKVFYVTDARFVNEINMLKDLGFNLVRLDVDVKDQINRINKRDGIKVNISSFDHKSENDFLNFDNFDLIINTSKIPLRDGFNYLKNTLY